LSIAAVIYSKSICQVMPQITLTLLDSANIYFKKEGEGYEKDEVEKGNFCSVGVGISIQYVWLQQEW